MKATSLGEATPWTGLTTTTQEQSMTVFQISASKELVIEGKATISKTLISTTRRIGRPM